MKDVIENNLAQILPSGSSRDTDLARLRTEAACAAAEDLAVQVSARALARKKSEEKRALRDAEKRASALSKTEAEDAARSLDFKRTVTFFIIV